ncbi:hypothetical protein [Streptomyces kebangsaanensis]|uniref:Uncharacterized protein n=1 Tax=Streptomyces kebangsaanensis TaxID=864058 RepID=A0ABW6L4S1_9ACTN|nr:hypothetical protein [Streptomyces kebangsaanensis]
MPTTLGMVLTAEGLLGHLGLNGWPNKTLHTLGLTGHPRQLVHDCWRVLASLLITGFPFSYLLTGDLARRPRPSGRGQRIPGLRPAVRPGVFAVRCTAG